MERRKALAALSALFGGAVVGSAGLWSGCARPDDFEGLLSRTDVRLLDAVGETILPATEDSPGAAAAEIGRFMDLIVTDCFAPEEQLVFQEGLLALNAACDERFGRRYDRLDPDQQTHILLELEAEAGAHEGELPHFYSMIKQLALFGYFTSEVGATQALRYVAVPGYYQPCIPYEEGDRAWAAA